MNKGMKKREFEQTNVRMNVSIYFIHKEIVEQQTINKLFSYSNTAKKKKKTGWHILYNISQIGMSYMYI